MTSSDGYNISYTYNANSGPSVIKRYGRMSSGAVGLIDDLAVRYTGNRPLIIGEYAKNVTDENSADFAETARYKYDTQGRITEDSGRGISNITYNHMDRPGCVEFLDGNYVSYAYSATGRKLMTSYTRQLPSGERTDCRYYCDGAEFVKNGAGSLGIGRYNTAWGYVDGRGGVFVKMRDYQGNIRAVVSSSGTVVQTTDYYPYGTPMQSSTGAEVNRYKYGGKEFETEGGLNQYDFEARTLIPQVGLFTTPDPQAGVYPWLNPYLYCAANPIKYIDPTGELWVERYINGVREIFYDRAVTDQATLEEADYYSDKRFSGVRLLEEGETINLGGTDYTFNNDYNENKYGTVSKGDKVLNNTKNIRGKDFDIFATSDNSCDPTSLHKNFFGTSYTGPTNPYTYEGESHPSYHYYPRNMSEIPSMGHDMAYDKVGASGITDALLNINTIEADEQFVLANRYVMDHGTDFKDRMRARAAVIVFSRIIVFKKVIKFFSN